MDPSRADVGAEWEVATRRITRTFALPRRNRPPAGCWGERGHDAPPDPKAWREHSNRGRRENYDRRGQRESREAGERRAREREGPPRGNLRADPAGEPSGPGAPGWRRGNTGDRERR